MVLNIWFEKGFCQMYSGSVVLSLCLNSTVWDCVDPHREIFKSTRGFSCSSLWVCYTSLRLSCWLLNVALFTCIPLCRSIEARLSVFILFNNLVSGPFFLISPVQYNSIIYLFVFSVLHSLYWLVAKGGGAACVCEHTFLCVRWQQYRCDQLCSDHGCVVTVQYRIQNKNNIQKMHK